MSNCLAGCMWDYNCPPVNAPGEGPGVLNAEVAVPVVIAVFTGGDFTVTVGNKSCQEVDHDACIMSFEYGFTDGYKANFEILDIQGGIMSRLLDGLVKCAVEATEPKYSVKFKFGWSYTDCYGGPGTLGLDKNPWIYCFVADLEVNYTGGKIKYRVECCDAMNILYDVKEDTREGDSDQPMKLEDAIRKLCNRPPKIEVEFMTKQPDGHNKTGIKWKKYGKGGPEHIWGGDTSNRLATITSWVEPYQDEEGRGIHVTTDNTSLAKIIVWADWIKKECKSLVCSAGLGSLGTFLVNAGKCSNVIEFQPNFKWVQAFGGLAAGGDTGTTISGDTHREETKKPTCEIGQGRKTGARTQIIPDNDSISVAGKDAQKDLSDSHQKHGKANRIWGSLQPIEAELRIVGNPDFAKYIDLKEIPRVCSIVAVNPFHIGGVISGNAGCGDWESGYLATPKSGCNQVLSNKAWMVKGINHAIQGGSYETTLSLFLAAPGIDVEKDDPLGGAGSQGYKPKNTC